MIIFATHKITTMKDNIKTKITNSIKYNSNEIDEPGVLLSIFYHLALS